MAVKTEIRPFDFSKLKKLTRKQVDISSALLEQYPELSDSDRLGDSILQEFANELGIKLGLRYLGMDEILLKDFLEGLPSPCVTLQLGAEPSGARVFLDMNYDFCQRLVKTVLGEKGEPPQGMGPLSPIEEGVLEFLIVKALNQIQEVSGVFGQAGLKLNQLVHDPKKLSDPSGGSEWGCLFKFYLGLEKQGGYLKVYFPHPLLEGTFLKEDVLSGTLPSDSQGLIGKKLSRVHHIKTSIWSEVGRVQLMSSEKNQLEKGDVILFDETQSYMGSQGPTGKAILRVGENLSQGILAEILDTEGKMVLKILDFYGG